MPQTNGQANQGKLFLRTTIMRKFDTKVQHLKYKVLREVAREAWNDTLAENAIDIPKVIVPGKIPTMRCCVYKERAILAERVKLAMGGNKANPNVIEVIDLACDECPMGATEVTKLHAAAPGSPLRGRMPFRRHYVRPESRRSHRQNQVQRVRSMLQSLPVQRYSQLQTPLRNRL